MIVIRNVFRCKPGQAKKLVAMFKETTSQPGMEGMKTRVMTDIAAPFWTVVFETEAESLEAWEREMQSLAAGGDRGATRDPMKGYMDLVDGGHREIFKIE
jgi:heme-degrading monooxygenase HmoA